MVVLGVSWLVVVWNINLVEIMLVVLYFVVDLKGGMVVGGGG